jgi:hypothetical protein
MIQSEEVGPGPYPAAARLVAALILFITVLAMWVNLFHPYHTDFMGMWSASVLALRGDPALAYDVEVHRSVQAAFVKFDGLMPFPYPPPFLLVLLPFGLLPYPIAAAAWIVVTFTLYFSVARRVWPGSEVLIAAYPAVLVNGIVGQNGFLTAGFFIAGLALLPKRQFLGGLVLGCLIIKPHLGVLIPLALIATRQWRGFAGAALSATGLILLGLAAFGIESYQAMLDLLPLYRVIMSEEVVGWHKMASVYASLRLLDVPSEAAWLGHIGVALAAAGFTWRVWSADCAWQAKAATLAAATLLISPYSYCYDMLILIIAFLWLLVAGANRPLLALLWCLPFISIAQNWGFHDLPNLMPVVPIALLLLIQGRLNLPLWGWARPPDPALISRG